MDKQLTDDAIMREMAYMNAVISRRARQSKGSAGAPFVLALLASHEEAMADGFAPRALTQVELSDAVGMRPQSLGPLLACLEQNGCIERIPFERDRRAHLVILTSRGRSEAQAARARQRAFAEETLACLTKKEKEQLGAIVLKLNRALT